ncbi:MAG: hypothetical protein LBH73_02035 [Spirochaetaceae bacterium]|jgi:hypothetical protein|nr:hypothetical protein [Spirochaetaceae bacterium]
MNESPYQSERVSQLLLERYKLGELDSAERQRVEELLSGDAGTAARLELLKNQDREIRAAYPLEKVLPEYGRSGSGAFSEQRVSPDKRFSFRRFRRPAGVSARPAGFPVRAALGALALCAAAALLFFFLPGVQGTGQDAFTDRVKGGAELRVYLKSGETPLADNVILREGSTVQLAYTSGESRYGVIFSIDGRQAVTLHYPYRSDGSTELVQGKRTALEEAYTLDDAPLCEIFFFVSSERPVDVGSVLNNARILAGDPRSARERGTRLFSGYELRTVYVGKE